MSDQLDKYQVMFILDHETTSNQALTMALEHLTTELLENQIKVIQADSSAEAWPIAGTNMDIDCFLISSNMELDKASSRETVKLLRFIKERQAKVPVFLLADRDRTAEAISEQLMELVNEFVWILEDSPVFIAGRVTAAIQRFRRQLLPPLMKAIWEYNTSNHEYSWAAPGHQGGIGFTKSPSGKKFYDFYGENLFRTDTGIERSSIGSLLDHTGAFADSENFAAKVFGSDFCCSVVAGTSGSNRTIMQICLKEGDLAICDRNCHKSIEQGLILTGAIPIYMLPLRNAYGIIGPVPRREMLPESIAKKIAARFSNPPSATAPYAVVTNCTYDGLCYNAEKVQQILSVSSSRLHFDEAWYGYARFNPMYDKHFAMRETHRSKNDPTIFATHSTHKLLNALSQASYIHVRNGRNAIDFNRFNQAYMMHATTSPLYAICASNDIASAMMAESGLSLTREVIEEAVDFRQALAKLYRNFRTKHSWFFKPWNPETVIDPRNGISYDFADAPAQLLTTQQDCWRLDPEATWHGFHGLDENWAMLDPIKVSILSPGMGEDGQMQDHGVPAQLVSAYLYHQGIVPTRTTDFQIMFLFSMGTTRGKWGTLINALLNFKQLYDNNVPLVEVLPELVEKYPEQYANIRLQDLGNKLFQYLKINTPAAVLNQAFDAVPEMAITPRAAFQKIVSGEVEQIPLDRLHGRIAATSIIPYPPGIPMVMSGEIFQENNSPQIRYLQTLQEFDREFPGFEHETEGIEIKDNIYYAMCLTK